MNEEMMGCAYDKWNISVVICNKGPNIGNTCMSKKSSFLKTTILKEMMAELFLGWSSLSLNCPQL